MTFWMPQDAGFEPPAEVFDADGAWLVDECDEATATALGLDVPPLPEVPESWARGALFDAFADDLEAVTAAAQCAVAAQWAAIADLLREARAEPTPWTGPDLSLDPLWRPPARMTLAQWRARREDVAVRSAVAEIAVRVRMSEVAVRGRATDAETLRARCPRLWAAFLGGRVSEPNARTAADLARSLPDDAACWAAFDDAVAVAAPTLPPAKFRSKARSVRERVHAESLAERHRRAAEDRGVWFVPELDGMASVQITTTADKARELYRNLDGIARSLRAMDGEERTLAQLRADAMVDLATGATGEGAAGAGVQVAVTVPALSLLGASDEPAVLDGYGPIDVDTARRLAGEATSWVRILTHPVTGVPLVMDRTTYRVPKALKRWLGARQPVCVFPGCSRPASDCQVDHRKEWQHGGTTDDANLDPLCEGHHVLKTEGGWRHFRDPDAGLGWWLSPPGRRFDDDPPPF